ncbi:hypothetical protein DPSP01_001147 [Paraphaeosphaeria sporulosa]|uniref:Uncharacterized protein n=1 Tax=Paraphaeosphaeria sporulosa TaxID=1460663 RepID=A0A177C2Z7_9PLEO|nr:uncharacterized protein CC84DRAFT_1178965 [Paraphaeosphaeria sporulosa]OAG01993.1 hypothetical protein CC84DRAFT_1178965 [Paraphaeosphaeria sporulosa]
MKSHLAISVLATLLLSVQATPAAIPELHERQFKAPVSCTATGGSTSSCNNKGLTRYGCAHTDKNRCSTVGTTPVGSTVQISCYQFGEVYDGNSMWYTLNPRTNGMMPAAFFSSCYGMSPC